MLMDSYFEKLAPFLGHIVLEQGSLEGDAGRMLARLNGKGDDVSAAQYAARKMFKDKIVQARKLVDEKAMELELKADFLRVLDEMDRVNKERNKYIHSEYFPEVDQNDEVAGAYYREIKQMGDIIDIDDPNSEIAVHPVCESDIHKLIEDMIALGLRIRAVSEAYFDTLPLSSPLPPPLDQTPPHD